MDNWFVKLHRKILDWEWYDDINTCRLFFHLLLKSNYEDNKWHWVEIKRWQRLTSLPSLSKETWLTIQQIRTSISRLKSTGEITDQSTNTFRLITVIKYNDYQDNQQANQQAVNRQSTANKEREELKEYILYEKNKNNATYYILNSLFNLWYIPSKTETIEKFREWVKTLLEFNQVSSLEEIKDICTKFELYRKTTDKNIKNYKSTFMNSILFTKNKKYAK